MGENADELVRLTAHVSGLVQGVGFRYWTRDQASVLGLSGQARNLTDGRVLVIAEGSRSDCVRLLTVLRGAHTPGRVRDVDDTWSHPQGLTGFVVD